MELCKTGAACPWGLLLWGCLNLGGEELISVLLLCLGISKHLSSMQAPPSFCQDELAELISQIQMENATVKALNSPYGLHRTLKSCVAPWHVPSHTRKPHHAASSLAPQGLT